MKLLLDIEDKKATDFIEMIKAYAYVNTESLSAPEFELLEEIREINKAFDNVSKIKSGKLKGRPVDDLLNQI